MSGKSAEVRVDVGLFGGEEPKNLTRIRFEELGVVQHLFQGRDETLLYPIGILGHLVTREPDLFQGSRCDNDEVVLGGVGVGEDKLDRLTRFDLG